MGKLHWHPKQHYAACASNRYTISTSCESLIRIITNDACNVVHARNFWCTRVLPATESYTAELITRGKIWFIFYILSRHTEREREKRVKRECSIRSSVLANWWSLPLNRHCENALTRKYSSAIRTLHSYRWTIAHLARRTRTSRGNEKLFAAEVPFVDN